MIVQDLAGNLFRATDAGPGLDHCWNGVPVKRTRDGFAPKAKARVVLVRKFGCKVVGEAA